MKTTIKTLLVLMLLAGNAEAGVQPAWMQRYNAGRTRGRNEAVAMALDSRGNLIVAGSSWSAQGDFDYVMLKYTPAGSNVWVRRYTSGGASDDQVRALKIDSQDNVHVTGTSVTIKYDSAGAQQWMAPYGGRALTCDTNGNVYVTGYLTNDFSTVKLAVVGTNVWQRTHDMIGQNDVSHQVILDADGNVYVAGPEIWFYEPRSRTSLQRFRVISYTPDGNSRFSTNFPTGYYPSPSMVRSLHIRGDSLLLSGNLNLDGALGRIFCIGRLDITGDLSWSFSDWVNHSTIGVMGSDQAPNGDVFLTGGLLINFFGHTRFRTIKVRADQLGTNGEGTPAWQSDYVGANPGYNRANAIGLDAVGNVYVTGQATGAGTETDRQDWATLKYSPDGQEQWVQRYNGPAQLDDVATCMAVTPSGEVYVAGWSAVSSTLTELVVIKYAELANIHVGPDQRAALQFFGTPGQSYRIDASTNLPNWESLGQFIADPAGIYRFLDTNAPNHPWRFYRTGPP